MSKTVDDVIKIFRDELSGWNLVPVPVLSEEEKEKIGVDSLSPQARILITPYGENIFVIFSGTSVTGTERPKPQIRLFMEGIIDAYKYSKIKQMRFFCFVICTSDLNMLKLPLAVIPDEYIVSLESSFDRYNTGRIDIRSMYDALEHNLHKSFFRLSKNDHSCKSVEQASFIRITDAHTPVIVNTLEDYLTYFDNRPYMLSVKEGMKVVYQPSALFEKAVKSTSKYPWNMLVFGAPGTGKSHLIEQKLLALKDEIGEDQVVFDRVTFYEDYTYQQFVVGYMPVPKKNVQETIEFTDGTQTYNGNIDREHISYEFVAGPFGVLLANAFISKIKGDGIKYILVIEELNRANAASVFGDLFQLLDRENGVSKYEISISDAFAEFLFNTIYAAINGVDSEEAAKIRIDSFRRIRLPENLYIWSTMNSADQGVFPLDSAFKRRWSFIYKDINTIAPTEANRPSICLPNCDDPNDAHAANYDWNILRKAINILILSAGFDEDRCVGYLFFSEEDMLDIEEHTTCAIKAYNGDG